MKRFVPLFAVLLILAVAGSCRKNPYAVSLTGVDIDFTVKRLEKDLFTVNSLTIKERVPALIEEYGKFLEYFSQVIHTGDIYSPVWHVYLSMFVNDRNNFEAYGAVEQVFAEFGDVEDGLRQGFRHYRYYFPGKPVPEVVTCVTGFNNSIIVGDSVIGIGLERYLGPDTEFYGRLGIYKYLTMRMDRPYIVPDVMYAWASTEWDYYETGYGADNVFARIFHEGKLHYFVRRMLPEVPEEVLFAFTPVQMKFCLNNEDLMWTYLVEHDLLFSTDQFVIRKLTGEAPFTSYFTNESPGKAAVWIGFRIVDQYMKRNPDVTLAELMEIKDYQKVLSGAKYNP